jgi:hypothetical protein
MGIRSLPSNIASLKQQEEPIPMKRLETVVVSF